MYAILYLMISYLLSSFLDICIRTISDAIRIKEFFALIRCDCQISPNIQGKGYSFVSS